MTLSAAPTDQAPALDSPAAPVLPVAPRPPTWRQRVADVRAQGPLMVASWAAVAVLAVVTLISRWVFIFITHPPRNFVWSDMQGYVDRAWRLADPSVRLNRFDTFYPPGTHMLMAPLFKAAGSREGGLAANQWLWWILAVVTVLAVGLLALRLFRHPLAAAIAMGGVLLHWPLTVYTGFYMSESPFTALMAVSLLLGLYAWEMPDSKPLRRLSLYSIAGLIAGVAATIRPQYAIGAATIGLPLLRTRFPFVRLPDALVLAAMFAAPCLGAIQLNRHAAGIPMGMSGNAGFNFYQGHCDVVHVETHGGKGEGWYAFAAPVRIQRVNNEGKPEKKVVIRGHMAWENDYFFAEGWKCIREEGWRHLARVYSNVEDLFAPADPWPPNTGSFARVTSWQNKAYCHALLFILPVVLWLARYRKAERWLLLQLATVLPVGFLFYGDSRYRVPYDIFGYLMLAGILVALLGLRRDARWVKGVGWRERDPISGPPAPSASTGSHAAPSAAP